MYYLKILFKSFLFITSCYISFNAYANIPKTLQCEGVETRDYVLNPEESWWGEWAGMKEFGKKSFVVTIGDNKVSLNYPFQFSSELLLSGDYYKSTDTVSLGDKLKLDVYIDVHRDTGMTFIQLHSFESISKTKKIGKGHIENGTREVKLYELDGLCKIN